MAAGAAPADPPGAAAAAASDGSVAPAGGDEVESLLQQRYGTSGFAKASVFAKVTCRLGRALPLAAARRCRSATLVLSAVVCSCLP